MEEKKEPVLARIDKAARKLLYDQPDGIIPVSGNSTIVWQEYAYEVYSYRTLVALVSFFSISWRASSFLLSGCTQQLHSLALLLEPSQLL